jgi:hypothetical protein
MSMLSCRIGICGLCFVSLAVQVAMGQGETGWKVTGKGSLSSTADRALYSSTEDKAGSNIRLASDDGTSATPTSLPQENGQIWREYDLRPYTSTINTDPKPEQAIVDWILRETGTETWFSEPLGILSARRDMLRVYHTPAVHEVVDQIVQRFVRSNPEKYLFGVRMMTVANANWRAKAMPRIRSVPTQTAGVEAWLMSREDAAIVLADLRRRSDYREHSSPNLLLANGRTQSIERLRPLAYVRGIRPAPFGGSSPSLEMGQIDEGFSLSIGPLLSLDQRLVDVVIKLETMQVERLNDVAIATPTAASPRLTTQIQVPQTSGWRLHERFRWPSDEVLLISCGVVAAPSVENPSLFPLRGLGPRPPRVDALLALDFKGPVGEISVPEPPAAMAAQPNFRGRY